MIKSIKKKAICILLSVIISMPAWTPGGALTVQADTPNLLANGNFEGARNTPVAPNNTTQWPEGQPKNWSYSGSDDTAVPKRDKLVGTYDSIDFKEGSVSLKLELDGAARYLENRLNPILPNTKYKFSFWYKTKDLTSTAPTSSGLLIRAERGNSSGGGATAETRTDTIIPMGTNDWTYHEVTFTSHSDARTFKAVVQLANHSNLTYQTAGTIWLDDMRLEQVTTDVTGIAINSPATDFYISSKLQLTAIITPSDADNKSITWTSSDTDIATVNESGLATGIAAGSVTITATSDDNNALNDSILLSVLTPPSADSVSLNNSSLTIDTNTGKQLIATLSPPNSTGLITWTSSDENVAVVNDGMVVGKSVGTTTITVTVNDHSDTCTVTVQEPILDEFDELRRKWRASIIPYEYDLTTPATQNNIEAIAEKAQYYWENMNRSAFTTTDVLLWTKSDLTVNGTPQQQEFTNFHKYLKTMAIAFVAEGSPLQYNPDLLNDIIRGMDWMNANLFTGHGGTPAPTWVVGNWWHRDIGMPVNSADIVTLIYDFIPQTKIDEYTAQIAIYASNPQVNATGGGNTIYANRVDKCKATMVLGILQKDTAKLALAASTLFGGVPNADVMGPMVTSGNGFYEDGSFVEHNIYPYTTSYGTVSLSGISRIMYMLAGVTVDNISFDFDSDAVARMYGYIDNSYIPVLYQGLAMDMTSGRSISRYFASDLTRGAEVIHAIILIGESAPSPYREKYLGYAKTWMQQNPTFQNSGNLWLDQKCQEIAGDSSINAIAIPDGFYPMNRMARTVYKHDYFNFGIAMHNYRIGTYESINGENPLAYHTADGMTYLYTDLNQFNGNYWATVDYKRLPGTTVDTISIDAIKGQNTDANAKIRWSAAANIDNYGAAGFQLDLNARSGMDLTANKSWFMLGNKIIALGSGINSTTGRAIETTVENRKLSGSGNNKFSVNGAEITGDHSGTIHADWAHIKDINNSSIGYYFPESQTLSAGKVVRTGNWNNVNTTVSDIGNVTDTYAQLIINHGTDPTNAAYQYVILPGLTSEETQTYSNNPDFEVLAHTNTLHAVYDKNLKITAINNYAATPQTVMTPLGNITISTTAAVLIREYDDGTVKVAVMEPTVNTAANLEEVTIDIDRNLHEVVSQDSNVTITAPNTLVTLTYAVNNGITPNSATSFQKTFTAIVKLVPLPVFDITENYVDGSSNVITAQTKTEILKNHSYNKTAPTIPGYIFDHIKIDGSTQTGSTAVIGNVDAPHTVNFVYRRQSSSSSSSSPGKTVLTLDKSSVTLWTGEKVTLIATVNNNSQPVKFTSNNTKVAVVDANGVVVGKATGTVTITAEVNGEKAICKITVRQHVTKISFSSSKIKLALGKTKSIKAVVSPVSADNKTIRYSSSNAKVATVNSKTGLIRAKSPGTVTITAKAQDGSGVLATCKVTVHQPVTKIKVNKTAMKLPKGKSFQIKITIAPTNATNKNVTYLSGNKKVATVTANGKIIAKGKGICYITVKAKDSSGTYIRIKVTVTS